MSADGVDVPIVVTTGDSVQQVGALDDALKGAADSAKAAADSLDAAAGATDRVASASVKGADALAKLRAQQANAATGGDQVAASQDAQAAATDRATTAADTQAGSLTAQADASARAAAASKALIATQEEMVANTAAANAALGSTYVGMSKLEALGTPALMKAATWSILAVGGVAYEGIKQYMNFNKLITQTVTQAGVPASQMGFLSNMAESISKMTGVGLTDVANNIYRVASGTAAWNNGLGATKKQLTDIVKSVTSLQVLGNVPAGAASEQAARVITALVNSNIKGVGNNANAAAALINAAVGSGDMRLNDLVPGIGRGVLQSAKANGLSAKDMLSWVALQTSMGTTASVAGNYVKTGINLLANPSAQGVLAESMIGIKPGEMQGILSGPGGLQAAVATFNAAIKKFNPSTSFVGYRTNIGNPRAGGTGEAAALNKLETWAVGEMPAAVLKQWQHGGSAASGGLTAANQQWITDLIMTKAFGGSKQFATLASIIKNPQLLAGIETSIGNKSSVGYMEKSLAIAENTPSQRFHKALASIVVDLVNAGKVLYPATIKIVDAFAWVIHEFVSWKPALYELGAAMAAVVGFAAVIKAAQIGKAGMAVVGGILNRLDPSGTNLSHFRNASTVATSGTIADLGVQVRAAGLAEVTAIQDGDTGITAAVKVTGAEQVAALAEVRDAVLVSSGRGVGKLGGSMASKIASGSSLSASEAASLGTTESLDARAMYAQAAMTDKIAMQRGVPISGLPMLTQTSGMDANAVRDMQMSAAFQADQAAVNTRRLAGDRLYRAGLGTSSSEAIALGSGHSGPSPVAVGWGEGTSGPQMSSLESTAQLAANPIASDAGSFVKKLGGLGAGALGMVGGPMGIAMIAATVLPMAMPYVMKGMSALGGVLGRWFGGSNANTPVAAGQVTHYTQTQSQYAANIASYKKQIAAMQSGGYNPLTATAADNAQWQSLHAKLNTASSGLKGLSASQQLKQFQQAWAATNSTSLASLISKTDPSNLLYKGMSNRGYTGQWGGKGEYMTTQLSTLGTALSTYNGPGAAMVKQMLAGAEGKGTAYSSLQNQTPQQIASLINRTLAGVVTSSQGILNTPEAQAALVGNKIIPHYADYMATQGIISKQANYANIGQNLTLNGLTNANSAQRFQTNSDITKALIGLSQSDLIRSKAPDIGQASKDLYVAASKKALEEATAFEVLRNQMVNKLDGQKLNKNSITDLATEITKQQGELYKSIGLNAEAFGKAFSAALSMQAGTLAGMINNANARKQGTGAKKP